jgi:hemoglobin
MAEEASAYDRLGGEAGLRLIVDDFVERMFADVMIGFFFRNADKRRIQELEYQHAAEHLGGPVRYTGRPLRQAHAAHPIMGGQFARRKELLRKTLVDHHAPPEVIAAWLAHTEALRDQITSQPDTECVD